MNIVLVHGILGFSHIDLPLNSIDYFTGVAQFLRQRFQAKVFAPRLDPTATIDLGGSRVRIQTLATIGTPHRGSPVADAAELILRHSPLALALEPESEGALGNILALFRISLDGLHDLTTKACDEFNVRCPDHSPDQKGVKYLSFAGAGRNGAAPTSAFFRPYHAFIVAHSKLFNLGQEQNDGVVPVASAQWGAFDSRLWPTDHADEIGHNLDMPLQTQPDPAVLQRYETLVASF